MSSAGSSLHQLILAGDPDAIAGFRDSHIHRIRRYVEEACPPELRDEASDAAFVNFLGRVAPAQDADLEELLLKSTRSCAAGRFDVQVPARAHRHSGAPEPVCLAMPELLAAFANDELPGKHDAAQHHLDRCPICAATAERMARAEQAYVEAPEWEPAPEQWLAVADTRDRGRGAAPPARSRGAAPPARRRGAAPPARGRVPALPEGWGPIESPSPSASSPEPEPEAAVAPAEPPPEPEPEAAVAPPEEEPEPEPTPEPPPVSEPEPKPAPPPAPKPAPPPPAQPATVVRRRQGGLVGAARRALRDRSS